MILYLQSVQHNAFYTMTFSVDKNTFFKMSAISLGAIHQRREVKRGGGVNNKSGRLPTGGVSAPHTGGGANAPSKDVWIAFCFAFRTFKRDTVRTSMNGRRGSFFQTDEVGQGGSKTSLFARKSLMDDALPQITTSSCQT